MPNQIRDISFVDKDSYHYIFGQNVDVQIKTFAKGLVRVNVYRPKTDKPVPVLVTYGPYGKDLPYAK
jgi:predicted acyl esterase